MRTLILGDLHHRVYLADLILGGEEPFDAAVFLGDYFDDFNDTPERAARTAQWLRWRLADPRLVFLWGNHDLAYGFSGNEHLFCPGFTPAKARAVDAVLTPSDWARLRLCAEVGPWLASHAGLQLGLVDVGTLTDPARREARCALALTRAAAGASDPLLTPGRDRGGAAPVGGITWLDWRAFHPVAGIHQIVGHTPGPPDRLRRQTSPTLDSWNYCLDGFAKLYAVVEDRVTTFKQVTVQGTVELERVEFPP